MILINQDDNTDECADLRADLAADMGGALVGLKSPLTGAVARTVTSKAADIVSIHDFGDSSVSGAVKLQRAFDSEAKQILIPDTVTVSSTVTSAGNVRLYGPGTIDLSGGGHIEIGTGVSQIADLSVDLAPFQTDITFSGAHGLVEGDVFCVWNPTDGSYNSIRPYYRAGDMFRVSTVLSPTQVRIYGIVQDAYAAADVNVYKLGGGSFEIDGLTLLPCPVGRPLAIDGCVGVKIHSLTIPSGADYVAVNIARSYDISIADNHISALLDDAYPIVVGSCQWVSVTSTRSQLSRRHVIAFGGGNEPGSVPCADVRITGLLGENIATNGIGAADMHGNCKRMTYENCILSMATMSGEDVTYRNCYITGAPAAASTSGEVINGSETVGGVFLIEGCHLVSAATGNTYGSHVNIGITTRNKPFRLIMRNNVLENVGSSPSITQPIKLEVASSTPSTPKPRIDVEIDGLTWIGSDAPHVLFAIVGLEDVTGTCSVRMKNVTGIRRLYGSSVNYSIPFEGPGLMSGITAYGDQSVILDRRTMTETVRFATSLTANRSITLPHVNDCAQGDALLVSRSAAGSFGLDVGGLKTLQAGQWCRIAYAGYPAIGSWILLESGSV